MANATAKSKPFDRTLIEGPINQALWKLAWPTMLQNIIGGLQGIIDHAMVGHFVGYTGNAAIGVSWQIFLVVVVFVSSLYSGMGVLVARFTGAGEADKVNRVVYQALLTSIVIAWFILAPLGYFFAPQLLDLVNASPEVKAEALPYLRLMFVFSIGMLIFFMFGGALRSAGDARTPLRLGVMMTILNLIFNVVLIRGLGPIPAFGTTGAAMGTVIASGLTAVVGIYLLFSKRLVVQFPKTMNWRPDLRIIASLFRFGLPTGFQGVAMNLAGVMLLRFIGSLQESAAAQAVYAVGYTELFSLITWSSVGLMSATAALAGQNLGAGKPERSKLAVHAASKFGLTLAAAIGLLFMLIPQHLLALFGMVEPVVVGIGVQLLRYLSISGLFITVALAYTGGLQGTGDTRSPLYISLISQIVIPLGLCGTLQALRGLQPGDIWLAIILGHATRCGLSFLRFRQGKWREIKVEIESERS
jgi:putative MATE family efflux protein